MKPVLVVLAFIFSVATHTTALPGEPLKALEQEVVVILKTKYAGAGLSKDKHLSYIRRFAANTREFVIYRLNKVGEWQNPLKVQAPNRGGISVRFYVKEGKWEGDLVVPYNGTKDFHVFKETHVVKNSRDGNWHIWAEILTPKVDSPEAAKNQLVKLFNNFEKYQQGSLDRPQNEWGSTF